MEAGGLDIAGRCGDCGCTEASRVEVDGTGQASGDEEMVVSGQTSGDEEIVVSGQVMRWNALGRPQVIR